MVTMAGVKWIAPVLLFLGTCAVSWGLLEPVLDLRGATAFIRPYHYGGILASGALSVTVFWPFYWAIRKHHGLTAASATLPFPMLLLGIWYFAFPICHRLAIHDQLQATGGVISSEEVGWFYPDDSGMGGTPIQLAHLLWVVFITPWWAALFIAFFPCFFGIHRSLQASALHDLAVEH